MRRGTTIATAPRQRANSRPPTGRWRPRFRPNGRPRKPRDRGQRSRGRYGSPADARPGMTVADIGAGDGYYTVRPAQRAGAGGRVLAQDIMPEVIERLADRVARERLDNHFAQTRRGRRPAPSRGEFRPRLHGSHVSRDRRALRLPVAAAPGAAQGRAMRRRRRRPADRAARHAVPSARLRIRGGGLQARVIRRQAARRRLSRALRARGQTPSTPMRSRSAKTPNRRSAGPPDRCSPRS